MKFCCEDLPQAGIILIPRDSQAFLPLLSDIERHLRTPPLGSPPPFAGETPDLPREDDAAGAILWNQNDKPICAFTLIWKYGWRDEKTGDRMSSSSACVLGVGHSPSLLLPFGLPEDRRAFQTYWHTILPHSKRYLGSECVVLGANADVRPPGPDEEWMGGVMRWGGPRQREPETATPSHRRPRRARPRVSDMDTVTLTLDAAFFSDGECVGPDTRQLWERVVVPAELHREVARAARGGVEAGLAVDQILADIELITGTYGNSPPPPPPPPGGHASAAQFRESARWNLARRLSHMRTRFGNDQTVSRLSGWADAAVPRYRRSGGPQFSDGCSA